MPMGQVTEVLDIASSSESGCEGEALRRPGPKAECQGVPSDSSPRQGALPGAVPLRWSVLGPDDAPVTRRPERRRRTPNQGPGSGERALKRLRALKRRSPGGVVEPPSVASGRGKGAPAIMDATAATPASVTAIVPSSAASNAAPLRQRAVARLREALGEEDDSGLAEALADAFLSIYSSSESRVRLLALGAALRRSKKLRTEVLDAGPDGAATLALQDPQAWAPDVVRAQRERWAAEALQEIKPAGPVGVCPACGGRAVVACGTAGSGRSGRLTKAFVHYSCLEDHCGQSSHVKQE
mmetsp:Transcript_69241/g.150689  ORF Transcript_69241/g.150689 Transcript_69241/m.150689 type:complete len:297 (-) Transcript_69241:111-1001(-)|eukprot:CAMPEP_0170614528 /NCGR_PEP_ID=MMETSP0224-20130122/24855_1 /TAXON_ID=285029 /ORGANISM="Togula jolla, Strain CCCM 725" /LENGTH=296 /DNA_ID=CAMNT_0010940205 /DNA_START=98 /DNA_END=988 /DNA_ORIENTATION=+